MSNLVDRKDLIAAWLEKIGLTPLLEIDSDADWVLEKIDEIHDVGVEAHVVKYAGMALDYAHGALAERKYEHLFRMTSKMTPVDAAIEIAWELERTQPVRAYIEWNSQPHTFLLDLIVSIMQERGILKVQED